jgi:hypothetical protein
MRALYGMVKLTAQQVVAIAARLLSIWIFLGALRTVSGVVGSTPIANGSEGFLIILFVLIVELFAAVFLWKFPLFVARKLVTNDGSETEHKTLTSSSLYSAGFVLMGFYFLYWALSDAVYWYAYWYQFRDMDPNSAIAVFGVQEKALMVSTFAEFLFSLFLIFGAKLLSGYIHKIRYAE